MQQINPKTSYKPNGKSDLSIDLKMKQITNIDNIFEDQRIIDANHLILSYNSIKFITENIYQIKNLLSLNISSNQLKEIINLQKFQKIEYLNFSTNKLTNVQNMGSLFSLVHLVINKNKRFLK